MNYRGTCCALGVTLFVALTSCNAILGNEPPTPRDGAATAGNDGGSSDAQLEAIAPLSDAGCPDGTKVCGSACFDLSRDPGNCGTCGYKCDDACTEGICAPKLLLGKMASPFALAVDATHVYVIDRGTTLTSGRIVVVPIAGGTPTDIATSLDRPYAIAADATPSTTDVYWSVHGGNGKVSRYRGTTTTDLPDKNDNNGVSGNRVRGLFVESAYLWGTDEDNGGRMWRATRNGNIDADETVATSGVLPATIEVKNNVAYAVQRLDGQCSPSSSVLKWAPGSAHLVAVPGGTCPYGMTVISGDVFFTERNQQGTLKKNGTPAPLAEALAYPNAVVTDNVTLYWTNQGTAANAGSIERIDVAAPMRPRTALAKGRAQPIAIAVDKTYVYWLEGSGAAASGELYRLPR